MRLPLVCCDEEVGLRGVSGVVAVALEGVEEGPDLGDVHPAQEVRVVSGVRAAELVVAADPAVHRPHVRDRLLGVGHGAERGDREVVAGALQASPRDRPCSRCGPPRRPSPRGAATAAAGPRCLRGTSRRRVHPPDRVVGGEPPLTLRTPDPLCAPRRVVARDAGAKGGPSRR